MPRSKARPRFSPLAILGTSAAAAVGGLMVGRAFGTPRKPVTTAPTEHFVQWEQAALARGDVGLPEGLDPLDVDETPAGPGLPNDYCVGLEGILGASPDEPHCVLNPLKDPRFAPIDRGSPQASVPSSSTWPVLTSHPSRLTVSYWTAEGPRGYSGRAFAAKRTDADKTSGVVVVRRHAGVDLFADAGDLVVAPEDGHVLAILPFHAGTWAVYLRSLLGDRIINLGEVEARSWRDFDLSPGQAVLEGQALARVGVQAEGSTMLHLESYAVGEGVADAELVERIRAGEWRWFQDGPPPAQLRDPSAYLLTAARRSYLREGLA